MAKPSMTRLFLCFDWSGNLYLNKTFKSQ